MTREEFRDYVEFLRSQDEISYDVYSALIDGIDTLEQEPKMGHWIVDVDRWGDVVTTVNGYRCDKCNAFNSDKDNYCPNCGARLVEEQEGANE